MRDFRYALRGLRRMRGIAIVAIATLALGIGGTTTMFSVVYAALLRPLPFADPDRLTVLFNTQVTSRDGLQRLRWSWPNVTVLQATASSFESVASFTPSLVAISGHGDPEQIDAEVVSAAYFRALRVAPAAGRVFGPGDDAAGGAQAVALISDRLAKRKFSGTPALGNTLRVNDVPLAIVGILPEGFTGLSGKAELWISPPMAAQLTYAGYLTTPQNFISVLARLKDGITLERANAELAAIGSRFTGDASRGTGVWSAEAVPLDDTRVDPTVRRSALVLLAAAACVLLIACINVASLLLARARTRQREMAVRLAIGASRASLVRQLLAEGLVMATIAGAAGTLLSLWGMDLIAQTAPEVIPAGRNNYGAVGALGRPGLDLGVLMFSLAVSLGTVVVFALVPALRASRPQLTSALKEDERGGGGRRIRTQSVFVVCDVALASFLLVGSGVLIDSFARIQQLRTGFVPDNVLTFWVRPPTAHYRYPEDGPQTIERLLTRIQAAPGIESAAANRCTPFMGCSRSVVFFADRANDTANPPGVGRHYASSDYFRTLGIPLVSGRLITDTDRDGTPPVAVVNQTGAHLFWPNENPIGKRVWFGTTTGPFADPTHAVEIVGVVGDVRYETIDRPLSAPRADFYTSYLQFAYPDTMFIVKTRGDVMSAVPAMRQAVAAVDPTLPIYDVMPLDARLDKLVARPRFNATLLGAFGAVALILAAIGVYGVLSYSVSLRLREIGVRLALGADARSVFGLVLTHGLRLAAAGTLLGLLGAIAALRSIQNLVNDVASADPRVFAIAAGVMLAVAALAASLPARRASSVDPIAVLRQE